MIAFWLRGIELFVLTAALLMQYHASNPPTAALAVLGICLAVHGSFVAASFVVSRRHASKDPPLPSPTPLAIVSIILREWGAHLALFGVIQPFERTWLGDDAPGRPLPGSVPVLLVHGYMCNRGMWWWTRRKLRAMGLTVATINLEPPRGSIDAFAEQLHARIETLCADTKAAQIALVGHSMGGLVARAYLRAHGPARIARLVTMASPHHGTWLANYGLGKNAREMQPGSAWLQSMELTNPQVPMLSVWSPADNFIAPQASSRLAAAREAIVPGLGHLAMLFSPRVLAILIDELAHPGAPQK